MPADDPEKRGRDYGRRLGVQLVEYARERSAEMTKSSRRVVRASWIIEGANEYLQYVIERERQRDDNRSEE